MMNEPATRPQSAALSNITAGLFGRSSKRASAAYAGKARSEALQDKRPKSTLQPA